MKRGICTYCEVTRELSSDHVPPKCLFAKPRPKLITVPSCEECNRGFAADDEYLRLVLVSRHDTGAHVDAQGVWAAAMRGLSRPNQLGLAKRFLREASEVKVRTPAGAIAGSVAVFVPETARLEGVAIRIVRGLFFHEHRQRIPKANQFKAYILDLVDPEAKGAVVLSEMVRKLLIQGKPTVIGKRAFVF